MSAAPALGELGGLDADRLDATGRATCRTCKRVRRPRPGDATGPPPPPALGDPGARCAPRAWSWWRSMRTGSMPPAHLHRRPSANARPSARCPGPPPPPALGERQALGERAPRAGRQGEGSGRLDGHRPRAAELDGWDAWELPAEPAKGSEGPAREMPPAHLYRRPSASGRPSASARAGRQGDQRPELDGCLGATCRTCKRVRRPPAREMPPAHLYRRPWRGRRSMRPSPAPPSWTDAWERPAEPAKGSEGPGHRLHRHRQALGSMPPAPPPPPALGERQALGERSELAPLDGHRPTSTAGPDSMSAARAGGGEMSAGRSATGSALRAGPRSMLPAPPSHPLGRELVGLDAHGLDATGSTSTARP
jgi:hypothetical protein